MIVAAQLNSLTIPDFSNTSDTPADVENFSIYFEAVIGPSTAEGGDVFYFEAVSAAFLAAEARTRWGRGLLFVPSFSESTVRAAVERLCSQVQRSTWSEVAFELNKVLRWEFDYHAKA